MIRSQRVLRLKTKIKIYKNKKINQLDFINIKNFCSGKDTVKISCSEWNNAICSNMDESRDYHPKWSEVREIPYYLQVQSKNKNDTNELIYKTETNSKTYQTNLWLPKGKSEGGGIK